MLPTGAAGRGGSGPPQQLLPRRGMAPGWGGLVRSCPPGEPCAVPAAGHLAGDKGGLQEVAEQLELERIGPQHQAGSDSLLTGMAFFKMREMFFEDHIDDAKYCGHLYGLGSASSYVQNGTGNAYEEEASKQS
ncbi:UNVERIFIED_CONTAM: CCR4-NOT transcription complex subunit 7 [Gekko kuhli]